MLRKMIENQGAAMEAFQRRGTSNDEKMQIVKMVEMQMEQPVWLLRFAEMMMCILPKVL